MLKLERTNIRFNITKKVKYIYNGSTYSCDLVNISREGARLRALHCLVRGDLVEFVMNDEGFTVNIYAEVAYVDSNGYMGIHFIAGEPGIEYISHFIKKLSIGRVNFFKEKRKSED